MSLISTITSLKNKINTLRGDNSVVNFAYTAEAYSTDDANGVTVFDPEADNNIPVSTNDIIKLNPFVTNKGFRDQASSFPRMFINHFFGRVSYNLNKTVDVLYGFLSVLEVSIGVSSGLATLDNAGRVPSSQITEDLIEYKGAWDASTNTPNLNTVAKTKGDMYFVSVAGTQDIGEGAQLYNVNDEIIYNGTVWQKIPAGVVSTVNNISPDSNGDVELHGNTVTFFSEEWQRTENIADVIVYIKSRLGYTS